MSNKEKIMKKSGGFCWYCGIELRETIFCQDHAIPSSRGGKDNIENLVPACRNCNGEKGNKNIDEYRLQLTLSAGGAPQFGWEQLAWLLKIIQVDPKAQHAFAFEKNFKV